jgi:hypothetical protein
MSLNNRYAANGSQSVASPLPLSAAVARAAESWRLEMLMVFHPHPHRSCCALGSKAGEGDFEAATVERKSLRIIADKAYPLREQLLEEEMLLLAPHRRSRTKPFLDDGRWLRRYGKRWKIERLFAWLHNFRRLVVRWEYHAENYLAFLQFG